MYIVDMTYTTTNGANMDATTIPPLDEISNDDLHARLPHTIEEWIAERERTRNVIAKYCMTGVDVEYWIERVRIIKSIIAEV